MSPSRRQQRIKKRVARTSALFSAVRQLVSTLITSVEQDLHHISPSVGGTDGRGCRSGEEAAF
jgi:hypothetical protein